MKEKYYQNLLNKEYKHCKEIVIKLPDSINDTYKDVFWLINDRQIKIIDQLEKNGWDEKIKDLFFFNNNLFDELEDSISEYETIRQNIIKDFYNVGKKRKN